MFQPFHVGTEAVFQLQLLEGDHALRATGTVFQLLLVVQVWDGVPEDHEPLRATGTAVFQLLPFQVCDCDGSTFEDHRGRARALAPD